MNDWLPPGLDAVRRQFNDVLAEMETRHIRRIEQYEREQRQRPPDTPARDVDDDSFEDETYLQNDRYVPGSE